MKDIGNHRINTTLVYERQQNTSETLRSNSTGFDIPDLNLDALQGALNTEPTQSYAFNSSVESFIARIQYDGFNKYFPSLYPTLLAAIGPKNGKPEIAKAAEEAFIDKMSGWFSLS